MVYVSASFSARMYGEKKTGGTLVHASKTKQKTTMHSMVVRNCFNISCFRGLRCVKPKRNVVAHNGGTHGI